MKPPKTFTVRITKKTFYHENGNPRSFTSNRDCPLVYAISLKLDIPQRDINIGTRSGWIGSNLYKFIFSCSDHRKLRERLEKNPHSYHPVTLTLSE